jgi:competence protein ComEA
MEKKVPSYLEFTKREKNGIVICIIIILLLLWIPNLYEKIYPAKFPPKEELVDVNLKLDSNFNNINPASQRKNYYDNDHSGFKKNESDNKPLTPFPFDPNKLSFEGWKQMGLKDKTIKTIMNYTSKGGKFRKPDDIKKVWGISEKQAEQLIPFVIISDKNESSIKNLQNNTSLPKKQSKSIDVNTCDSATLEQLKGIGAGFARRIIHYRDRLGGFHSIAQIAEVYGLPDSVFQKIKPLLVLSNDKIKKININTAQLEELKSHPYIRYKLANAIIQYRNQHGNFQNAEDLKKIILMDNDSYSKIINYISLR